MESGRSIETEGASFIGVAELGRSIETEGASFIGVAATALASLDVPVATASVFVLSSASFAAANTLAGESPTPLATA